MLRRGDAVSRFSVVLICCGMTEPRVNEFDAWDEADAYRRDWVESGKSDTAIGEVGHDRVGVIRVFVGRPSDVRHRA